MNATMKDIFYHALLARAAYAELIVTAVMSWTGRYLPRLRQISALIRWVNYCTMGYAVRFLIRIKARSSLRQNLPRR